METLLVQNIKVMMHFSLPMIVEMMVNVSSFFLFPFLVHLLLLLPSDPYEMTRGTPPRRGGGGKKEEGRGNTHQKRGGGEKGKARLPGVTTRWEGGQGNGGSCTITKEQEGAERDKNRQIRSNRQKKADWYCSSTNYLMHLVREHTAVCKVSMPFFFVSHEI